MPVKINSFFITPAPIVTFEKVFNRNMNGVFGADYNITLNGQFLAYKGNPISTAGVVSLSSDGVYGTYSSDDDPIYNVADTALLDTIMKKQEQLRSLVSSGQSTGLPLLLEITGFGSTDGLKAYCDVENISFDDQSRWTTRCGYTIVLKTSNFTESANDLFDNNSSEDAFDYYVSEVSEDWSIEEAATYTATAANAEAQNKLFSISHTVSAIGKRVYVNGVMSTTPLQQAMGYVNNVIGLGRDNIPTSLLPIIVGLEVYDRKLVETINKFTGSYQVAETFTLGPAGQAATESVTINIEQDLGSIVRISIDGRIQGLRTNDISDTSVDSYANAVAYWDSIANNIYNRANSYLIGGCNLNTIPSSTSIGRNITEGLITYNYSYDNRPANIITGALSEDIQISDTYPGQLINVVPVIGRSQPIIQYINSRSEYKRSLQITANMPFVGCVAVKPPIEDLTTIFDLYKPSGTRVYYSAPSESFNPKTGAYSYSIDWTFEG